MKTVYYPEMKCPLDVAEPCDRWDRKVRFAKAKELIEDQDCEAGNLLSWSSISREHGPGDSCSAREVHIGM